MKKFLLTTLLFVLCAFGATAQTVEKFYFGVTGYSDDAATVPVTVDMTVYNDFHFVINLPEASNSTLSASTADILVRMTNVEGLAIEGTKIYRNTINTGVDGIQAVLATKLSNAYSFGSARIPVTVNGEAFTYNISRSGLTITGTPSSSEAAKTAWNALMESIDASSSDGDSHFLFKKGSTFVIGNSCLTFVEDYTMFQGSTDYSTLFTTSNPAVVIEELGTALTNTFQLYLAEESTLALGHSEATVKGNMNIGVTGFGNFKSGVFQYIQDKCDSQGTKGFIHAFLDMFNDLIGMVDGASLNCTAREMKDALGNKLQLGDVDESGVITVTDISILKQYLLTKQIPDIFNFWAADACFNSNEDSGKYNISDVDEIQQIIFNQK